MIGSSSTWYARSASFTISRSSSTRAEAVDVLEDMEQLLRPADERVRLGREQHLVGMDAAPAHADREGAGRFRRADVERRVADVRGLGGVRPEAVEGREHGIRSGLVALRVLARDDDREVLHELREALERER